ncbi:uncharacterized protein LOC127277784 [Leptopilina boulardi]|uniref:uncharacterized protein LOC127277784 n=1 Tax=Leptopilina boulardi TaxID=63433 RepID=UPI0021F51E99|nr:uncharacterized protein LOC127277784 [Leptopilina boulardi]
MTRLLIVLAVVSCIAIVESKIFKSCKGNITAPTDVRIAGCDSSPCILTRGTSLKLEMDFVATTATDKLKPKMYVNVGRSKKKYYLNIGTENVCDSLQKGKCPLKIGDTVTVALEKAIPPTTYLVKKATVTFELSDSNNEQLVCLQVKAKVVRNPNELK